MPDDGLDINLPSKAALDKADATVKLIEAHRRRQGLDGFARLVPADIRDGLRVALENRPPAPPVIGKLRPSAHHAAVEAVESFDPNKPAEQPPVPEPEPLYPEYGDLDLSEYDDDGFPDLPEGNADDALRAYAEAKAEAPVDEPAGDPGSSQYDGPWLEDAGDGRSFVRGAASFDNGLEV